MPSFLTDFEPDSHRIRQIAADLQNHMALYGYMSVDTPIIEEVSRLAENAHGAIDDHAFSFDWAGHELTARSDFTTAALRQYLDHNRQDIVRWQFSGPLIKTHPQDPSHIQQRYYVGAELLGMSGPEAEAEVLSMTALGLARQGFEDWVLVIGHAGLTRQTLTHFGLPTSIQELLHNHRHLLTNRENGKATLRRQLSLDWLCVQYSHESGGDSLAVSDAQRLLDMLGGTVSTHSLAPQDIARYVKAERIIESLPWDQIDSALVFLQQWLRTQASPKSALNTIEGMIGDDDVAWQMCADWKSVFDLLNAYEVPEEHIHVQPDWHHTDQPYTGIIFEFRTRDGVPLAAGGRYNEFVRSSKGSQTIPAIGFASDISRLAEFDTSHSDGHTRTVSLITGSHTDIVAAKWAQALRQRGIAVTLVNAVNARADTAMVVREDGTVQYQQQFYSMEQIDFLMITLNGLANL